MISGSLQEAAIVLRGELTGEDRPYLGVSTDTRRIEAGQLFVALKGPRFDGHEYIPIAAEQGAAGAVVSTQGFDGLPCIRVPDTLRALGDLARDWRSRFDLDVIGVTGSAGKTTVKEMIAAILRTRGPALVTSGNLNNEIGVPLTIFGLSARYRAAVIEMGANHADEIRRLAAIARPNIGVVTLAGAAHLEGFGSIEGVARAKGELFESLPEDGVAVVNADDCYAGLWRRLAAGRKLVTFGLGPGADFTAKGITEQVDDSSQIRFTLVSPNGDAPITLALAGRHNVNNALAAAASAIAAGASLEDVREGLRCMSAVDGRMALLRGAANCRIIDDTYNANPGSMRAALDFLTGLEGLHWAILGDMGELGEQSEHLHAEVGDYARSVGVEKLFVVGRLSQVLADHFGAGAESFSDVASLLEAIRPRLSDDVNVLVKGSRSMGMERIVAGLTAASEEPRAAEGGR